jgi:predicted DNA-binding protein with PD1-like motif
MPPTTSNRRKAASANEGKAKKRKANDDTSSATPQKPSISPGYALQAHALRWGPGTDVVPSLLEAVATVQASNGSASACVVTAVGSLSQVTLRMANASRTDGGSNEIRTWEERLEIVSLVGTFASDGTKHLHMVRLPLRQGAVTHTSHGTGT